MPRVLWFLREENGMNVIRPNLRTVLTNGLYHMRGPCMVTGHEYYAIYPKRGIDLWLGGCCIQNAMPDVSENDREFLVSGISPAGWDRLFAESGESNT